MSFIKNTFFCLLFINVCMFGSEIFFNDDGNIRDFGGWSVDEDLFSYVRKILPEGKIILELGSGWASGEFSKYYKIFSVEHDSHWLNRYNTQYIYAPIKNGWYDTERLQLNMPEKYDLILVDGPPQFIGREGFYKNIHMFKTDGIIIFDDVNREDEYNLMVNVASFLKREFIIITARSKKQFGVIGFQ